MNNYPFQGSPFIYASTTWPTQQPTAQLITSQQQQQKSSKPQYPPFIYRTPGTDRTFSMRAKNKTKHWIYSIAKQDLEAFLADNGIDFRHHPIPKALVLLKDETKRPLVPNLHITVDSISNPNNPEEEIVYPFHISLLLCCKGTNSHGKAEEVAIHFTESEYTNNTWCKGEHIRYRTHIQGKTPQSSKRGVLKSIYSNAPEITNWLIYAMNRVARPLYEQFTLFKDNGFENITHEQNIPSPLNTAPTEATTVNHDAAALNATATTNSSTTTTTGTPPNQAPEINPLNALSASASSTSAQTEDEGQRKILPPEQTTSSPTETPPVQTLLPLKFSFKPSPTLRQRNISNNTEHPEIQPPKPKKSRLLPFAYAALSARQQITTNINQATKNQENSANTTTTTLSTIPMARS